MTTVANIKTAHVVYSVNVPWCKDGPFYIGSCPLDRLHKIPDARRNSEFARLITADDLITVQILAMVPTAPEASEIARLMAVTVGAWANRASPPPEPAKNRVRELATGVIHASAAAAGRANGMSRQAVGQFIARGMHFERCE